MNIRQLSLIERKPNQEIDVQTSLQAIAKELIAWRDEERRIRSSRRYKAAIRRVFRSFNTYFPVPHQMLIPLVLDSMRVQPESWKRVYDEVVLHIHLNRGGYLRTVPGKAGGVELTKP